MGIVLSGGPNSVYDEGAPTLSEAVVEAGVPVLGICYGMQLLAQRLGGQVARGTAREYGPASVDIERGDAALFKGLPAQLAVWMSHGDRVTAVPEGFSVLARSENGIVAAIGDDTRRIYGTQFHPEVHHTPQGAEILHRFLYDICGCRGSWTPDAFVEQAVADIRVAGRQWGCDPWTQRRCG